LSGSFVSASLFPLLGAEPIAGRVFSPDESEIGTARPVAVMSEGVWRRQFGADPGIVGRAIVLNGQPFTVIGIIPSTFTFFGGTDVWVPITYYPNTAGLTRKDHSMTVVGRLRAEVTVAGAESEMRAIAARVAERYPAENGGTGAHVESLHTLLVGDVRAPLYIVMGAVALLLLIACANVANLQLSHAVARRREMSVRAALGAGRQRLARQLLTESVILSALGGVLGLVVAYGGVAVLVKIIPIDLTFFSPISIDARVMAFAALIAIGTGVVFGLAPALHASRTNLNDALATRTGGLAARVGRVELRGVFVIAQIALSVVLLVGAGLLARTLVKLQQVDLGFDTSNLLTMEFRLPATKYTEPRQISDFFTRAVTELRSVPGVGDAALARAVPLSGNSDGRAYAVAGAPAPEKRRAPTLQLNTVSRATSGRCASGGSPSSVSLAMRSTSGHRTNRARRHTSRTCRHRRSSRASSSARIATRWRSRPPFAKPSGVWTGTSLCGRYARWSRSLMTHSAPSACCSDSSGRSRRSPCCWPAWASSASCRSR